MKSTQDDIWSWGSRCCFAGCCQRRRPRCQRPAELHAKWWKWWGRLQPFVQRPAEPDSNSGPRGSGEIHPVDHSHWLRWDRSAGVGAADSNLEMFERWFYGGLCGIAFHFMALQNLLFTRQSKFRLWNFVFPRSGGSLSSHGHWWIFAKATVTRKLLDEANLNSENKCCFFFSKNVNKQHLGFITGAAHRSVETRGVSSCDTFRPIPKKSPRSESVAAAPAASVYAYAAVGLVIGR